MEPTEEAPYRRGHSVARHIFAKLLHLPTTLVTEPARRMAVPLVAFIETWIDALT